MLEHALAHALAYLENLQDASVSATATLDELRMRLARPLTDNGVEAAQVIDEFVADVAGGVLGSPHLVCQGVTGHRRTHHRRLGVPRTTTPGSA